MPKDENSSLYDIKDFNTVRKAYVYGKKKILPQFPRPLNERKQN